MEVGQITVDERQATEGSAVVHEVELGVVVMIWSKLEGLDGDEAETALSSHSAGVSSSVVRGRRASRGTVEVNLCIHTHVNTFV